MRALGCTTSATPSPAVKRLLAALNRTVAPACETTRLGRNALRDQWQARTAAERGHLPAILGAGHSNVVIDARLRSPLAVRRPLAVGSIRGCDTGRSSMFQRCHRENGTEHVRCMVLCATALAFTGVVQAATGLHAVASCTASLPHRQTPPKPPVLPRRHWLVRRPPETLA